MIGAAGPAQLARSGYMVVCGRVCMREICTHMLEQECSCC